MAEKHERERKGEREREETQNEEEEEWARILTIRVNFIDEFVVSKK